MMGAQRANLGDRARSPRRGGAVMMQSWPKAVFSTEMWVIRVAGCKHSTRTRTYPTYR